MFREKLKSDKNQRGYLYIRDSVYLRDKRTLKKTPRKKGDGIATKERGKYSVKKDIYCGKIIEVSLKNVITFAEFLLLQNQTIDMLKDMSYDDIINTYIKYVLYVYQIEAMDFFSNNKQVYTVGDGYFSLLILKWFKQFSVKTYLPSIKDFERFYYRCQDCGIFDDELIHILYLKFMPEIKQETKETKQVIQKNTYNSLTDFIKENNN